MKSRALQGAEQLRLALGQNVRRLRIERGLSRRAFADLAGVSGQYVGWVESGRANPRSTTLAALAAALGVEARALLATVDLGTKTAADRSD